MSETESLLTIEDATPEDYCREHDARACSLLRLTLRHVTLRVPLCPLCSCVLQNGLADHMAQQAQKFIRQEGIQTIWPAKPASS